MFGLIAVLIFFMFRNGKKRQKAMQELQSGLRPGAEVMLQSGIYGTVVEMNEEENRATIQSGSSTLVVHRNAISQIVTAVDAPADAAVSPDLAPDDDPAFGERIASENSDGVTDVSNTDVSNADASNAEVKDSDGESDQTPKA
ncbi:preprotein translocase subunit YajC [Leucobacter viscericola]|nr:preprotein translocase subunit YajC [Leucobacter viscericola]